MNVIAQPAKRAPRAIACLVLATAALVAASPARAEDAPAGPDPAVKLGATFNADVMDVVSGGNRRGVVYVDRLLVSVDVDLERAIHWTGGAVHVDLMNNRGGAPGDNAGAITGVSRTEIEPRPIRIVQAYLRQTFAGGRGSAVLGFYDVGADFYATPSAEIYLGPAGGLAPELAAVGPPDFPETALLLQLRYAPTAQTYVEAMAANAHQGVIGDVGGADFSLRHGLFLAAEVGYSGPFKLAIGAWRDTQSLPDIRDLTSGGDPIPRTAHGAYALLEAPLFSPEGGVRKTTAFIKGGVSDGDTTPFLASWVAGVLIEHVFNGRPDSAFACSVVQGRLSRGHRANQADAGLTVGPSETEYECTYADTIAPHLVLQPDLQWVHRPSGQQAIHDALLLSLRLKVTL
jgi:porin